MSIINQMLRDLDARHASEQERAGLPPRLRTLPPRQLARGGDWRTLLAGMVAGGAIAGVATHWYFSADAPPPAPPPAATAAPTVPPAPTSPAAEETPPAPPAATEAVDVKLPPLLASPPPEPAPAKAAPEPRPAAEPAKPARETRPAPAPAAAEAAPADAQIDKRAKGGQAREMADGEYRKGMQAVRRGDGAGAAPLFRHALELDPAHARARQALLSVLVGSREWAEARQVARSGLELEPSQTGWATILARLQYESGDAAAALATLARHAAHAGGDAEYQGLHAYLLQRQQRPAEAAQRFRAALALSPGEGRWWFGLALALEAAGQPGEAKEAYAKARESGNLPADMQSVVEQKLK